MAYSCCLPSIRVVRERQSGPSWRRSKSCRVFLTVIFTNTVWQAHAMLPHLSAGAGQGVEDAFVLARLLGDPRTNASNLEVSDPKQLWHDPTYNFAFIGRPPRI